MIQTDAAEAKAILGAMRRVSTGNGRQALSEACASGLRSAAQHVFNLDHGIRLDELPDITPTELASKLVTREQKEAATRFLALMPLVDGRLDEEKIDVFLQYADALEIREDYVMELAEACRHLDSVLHDMTRQNIKSLWDEPWDGPTPWR